MPDTIVGTPADDAIYGRGGNDQIDGGGGNDDLDGGLGGDDLRGGAGNDAVSYPSGEAGVTVTIDDAANDGGPLEGDNVHTDVEGAYGGAGDDKLVGSGADNTLDGGAGNDVLVGGDGVDGLYGGRDRDDVRARDGEVDTVDCGPGRDRAQLDPADLDKGCERTNIASIAVDRTIAIPQGRSTADVCRGRVQMVLRRGRKRLASTTVRLPRSCHYGCVFRVLRRRTGGAKSLTVVLRLIGSPTADGTPSDVRVPVTKSAPGRRCIQ
jgi:hypothetical protein